MSFTKRNTIICDECGLFCKPYDEYICFGTKDYDYPEPLDPNHVCKKCWKKFKQQWITNFKQGQRNGDWQKSRAEIKAAKECGLIWIHSNGIGKYGTSEHKNYCYVTQEEFNRLSNSN